MEHAIKIREPVQVRLSVLLMNISVLVGAECVHTDVPLVLILLIVQSAVKCITGDRSVGMIVLVVILSVINRMDALRVVIRITIFTFIMNTSWVIVVYIVHGIVSPVKMPPTVQYAPKDIGEKHVSLIALDVLITVTKLKVVPWDVAMGISSVRPTMESYAKNVRTTVNCVLTKTIVTYAMTDFL